jgi:hypothetical protein
MPTARARLEWKHRAVAEYTSAATAARVLHLAIVCGLPRELLDVARRVIADELDHAELSDGVRQSLGDTSELEIEASNLLVGPATDGPLAALVDEVVPAFCLGESLAVPLFAAMREGTTHPLAAAALVRILQDEAVHRKFGWDVLDASLVLDPAGVRARVRAGLPSWITSFRMAYRDPVGAEGSQPPLTVEEVESGLIGLSRYAQVYDEAMGTVILPRFAARGIAP